MRRPSKYDDFWTHVRKGSATECWLWTAKFNHDGYGQFSEWAADGYHRHQRTIRAHVRAYELTYGPIGEKLVRHTCDNPPCCNPVHLLLGTQRDNIIDAVMRGRHRAGRQRLLWQQAEEIRHKRQAGVSRPVLAQEYGVDPTTISHITAGRRHPRRELARV